MPASPIQVSVLGPHLIDDDPDAAPVHVVRFGPQVKARGVDPGSRDVDRTIGYITKYLTKTAAYCQPRLHH